MEKGSTTKRSNHNQPSPGVSKETAIDGYETRWEDIAEIDIASIQACPIIPDYQKPTRSTLPIVVRTPEACFCIDGSSLIEQANAAGRATIRCHTYHIAHHSDAEFAIRKVAIRVMPQGGRCTYAEMVRNTRRLYALLMASSDDLMLLAHGGDRRSDQFTSFPENNVRVLLAHRLGKSPTTINKYLQHGEGLNDETMQELVDASAPKLFFEAVQAPKQTIIAAQQSEQKDPAAIAEATSKEVMQWLAESQEPQTSPAAEQEGGQPQQAERSASRQRPAPNGNRGSAPTPRSPRNGSDDNQDPPTSDPTPTDEDGLAAGDPTPSDRTAPAVELKRIGEALIEIAENQESPTPRQIESIRTLIVDLSTVLQRLAHPATPEGSETGGAG